MPYSYLATVTPAAVYTGPEEAAQNPHHVLRKGKLAGFKNTYDSWGRGASPLTIFGTFVRLGLKGEVKSPDTSPPTVPVVSPTFLPARRPTSPDSSPAKLRATWLGHACYYVEFPSGLRVLFDPVFEDRCSPFSFMGPKRFTHKPCGLADLPVVDAVVISHSHYDHLSHPSVLELQKHHPNAHFFVGLGLAKWFRASGVHNVTEMDWWEEANLKLVRSSNASNTPVSAADVASFPEIIEATVCCTPCQHTSARTPFDRDTTLWCSWAVRSGGKSVWFGGDTGYRAVPYLTPTTDDYLAAPDLPRCPQFAQIGQLRGPFDLGLIPIGAYAPRAAFSPMHANPFDAVEIFKDTRCKRAMGIHWGTWALTTEEVMEPPRLLREALKRSGIEEAGTFDTCNIGESREF
ncbi:N-acyl-phosphatidylethanolamine-hydrolyzing phospholipase D [Ceratocystis platani]|nr:N-acyl-phosphatidylethanolamine-hydrolyzing phospholipase D [Ceratocystis platani]